VASNGSGCDAGFTAESELVFRETAHAAFVHNHHHQVRVGRANLEPETTTFHADGFRGSPSAASFAADGVTFTKLPADYKAGLFQSRNDDDAVRFLKQILRNALIGSGHDFVKYLGRIRQPLRRCILGINERCRRQQRERECNL
jgi:hypothetical protein